MGNFTHDCLDFLGRRNYSCDIPRKSSGARIAHGGIGMVPQVEIAHRVGLDVSSVNKILNRRSGPVFRKETIRKVFKIAKDMGYDFGRLKYAHRRRFARKELSLGVELYVYHKDGSLYDQ